MRRHQIEAAWRGIAPCMNCGIRDLVLFADLDEQDFSLIHLPIEEIELKAGQRLYNADEDGTAIYTIRRGLVKLVQYLPDGTQRIVRLCKEGATVGLEVTVGSAYEHTAIALQPVLACRIPRDVVDRLNRETPRLHKQLMQRWHQALQKADAWLTDLSTGNARQRAARLLLHLEDARGEVHLFSREDLGSMIGLTTETASRTVAEFKRKGLITELGANHFRCNHDGLEAVADKL